MNLIIQDDELLDIVNDQDIVIGNRFRSEVYAQNIKYIRVINGFLKNERGQLWIPRRTAHKKLFPSCLDVSVGGHVASGESYLQSFERELKEELNLNASEVIVKQIAYLTPQKHKVSAFMHVYEIAYEQTPPYNEKDFTESFWVYPAEFLEKLESGDKAKDDLSKLIKLLYIR